MVLVYRSYQKSGNSRKYNGLGCFFLIRSQRIQGNKWFGLCFLIKSHETQGNIMVVGCFFFYQKPGSSKKYNGLGGFPLSEARNLKEYSGVGCFFYHWLSAYGVKIFQAKR